MNTYAVLADWMTLADWKAIEYGLVVFISDYGGVDGFEAQIAAARVAFTKVRHEIAALEPTP